MKTLIEGAYDLHIHSAPDLLPRKMDDLEMAERIIAAKMAGFAIKSHYFCTAERATLVKKLYPACEAIGTVTLNRAVGGINPHAVEMAGRAGAKLVWFPTCDSTHEREHVFTDDANKKLPYWAQLLIEMKAVGLEPPPISIIVDGKLTDETYAVLDIIAEKRMILATSHISKEECFALVQAARERKVEKIIITHVDFPSTFYSVEEQKELASFGAYMEHCYTTWATGKVELAESIHQIKELGPERVIISTDLGQKQAIYPDEGMAAYAEKLSSAGFSDKDIKVMVEKNPKNLLN